MISTTHSRWSQANHMILVLVTRPLLPSTSIYFHHPGRFLQTPKRPYQFKVVPASCSSANRSKLKSGSANLRFLRMWPWMLQLHVVHLWWWAQCWCPGHRTGFCFILPDSSHNSDKLWQSDYLYVAFKCIYGVQNEVQTSSGIVHFLLFEI